MMFPKRYSEQCMDTDEDFYLRTIRGPHLSQPLQENCTGAKENDTDKQTYYIVRLPMETLIEKHLLTPKELLERRFGVEMRGGSSEMELWN